MNQDYIQPNPWSIIEEDFDQDRVKSSESLFSLGNGAMGQRANFEESYSGPSFQGSYIGGVYYPDKTRVGWWKNGYPEYFAKVINAPNWIGIDVEIDGTPLDLATCSNIKNFKRELNMKEGWYRRNFVATTPNNIEIEVVATRFLSLSHDEVGAIKFEITPLNSDAKIVFKPYVDAGINNEDSNWDDKFWNTTNIESDKNRAFIESHTMKTHFNVCTFMQAHLVYGDTLKDTPDSLNEKKLSIGFEFHQNVKKGEKVSFVKFGGYTVDRNHDADKLTQAAHDALDQVSSLGYDGLLEEQKKAWAEVWEMSDITIEGDVKAQQGIRFNIFQLNQTYTGTDSRLNIGPKGFTGEKYGGSTYWDTEAYCLPFYMATKNQEVARKLLKYRYNHLEKAIENAEKLGFKNGAALYPMVTMNGEECHNEWEITFEEIHRNGAIAYAIFNYIRYTGDERYLHDYGLEVLISISRFWKQRVNFSEPKQQYVMLGVTGPNEYENNVHNNWYTNMIASWTMEYTMYAIDKVKREDPEKYKKITEKLNFNDITETNAWREIVENLYYPYDSKRKIYLQQEGYLDKEQQTVDDLLPSERPINQHWSWDKILRSCFIKQADVLQGLYFFEDRYKEETIKRNYDFYEARTVHESSLSPCVHSILAAKLGYEKKAYSLYLRTARLDLDDYNNEVAEGCHVTSMAGTYMSIVEGFGGMRIYEGKLHFNPFIPDKWDLYSFIVKFRDRQIKVEVDKEKTTIYNLN